MSVARPLREAREPAQFGGKAAALAIALGHELPVPDGFALDFACADDVARGGGLEALSAIWEALGPGLAVRSSAIGEDGAATSFAGQHLSVLAVQTFERLVEAVRAVHASAHTAAALAYRTRLGISGPPRMGVVVQRLVAAEVAGVLFTRNPVTGADERVVEAAWGLGEVVVSGRVVPDSWRLARGGGVIEHQTGEKDVSLHPADDALEERPVPPERVAAPCLDAGMLVRLEALATRCEAVWPGAHDLEFAFANDTLHLLQRRPVTR